jgi:hypothetical protein
MPGVRSPGPWHLSVPAMQQDGRRAGEAMPGTAASTPRLVLRGAVGRQQGRAPHRLCRRERRKGTDGATLVPAVPRLHEQG